METSQMEACKVLRPSSVASGGQRREAGSCASLVRHVRSSRVAAYAGMEIKEEAETYEPVANLPDATPSVLEN